jgi:hypothetical protein
MGALRDAALALGGSIEIASEAGVGTRLRLRFPAEARHSLPPQAAEGAAAPRAGFAA